MVDISRKGTIYRAPTSCRLTKNHHVRDNTLDVLQYLVRARYIVPLHLIDNGQMTIRST